MEIGLKEGLIIAGLIVIAIIVIDGWRRASKQRSRLKIDIDGSLEHPESDSELSNPELPNGGARIVRAGAAGAAIAAAAKTNAEAGLEVGPEVESRTDEVSATSATQNITEASEYEADLSINAEDPSDVVEDRTYDPGFDETPLSASQSSRVEPSFGDDFLMSDGSHDLLFDKATKAPEHDDFLMAPEPSEVATPIEPEPLSAATDRWDDEHEAAETLTSHEPQKMQPEAFDSSFERSFEGTLGSSLEGSLEREELQAVESEPFTQVDAETEKTSFLDELPVSTSSANNVSDADSFAPVIEEDLEGEVEVIRPDIGSGRYQDARTQVANKALYTQSFDEPAQPADAFDAPSDNDDFSLEGYSDAPEQYESDEPVTSSLAEDVQVSNDPLPSLSDLFTSDVSTKSDISKRAVAPEQHATDEDKALEDDSPLKDEAVEIEEIDFLATPDIEPVNRSFDLSPPTFAEREDDDVLEPKVEPEKTLAQAMAEGDGRISDQPADEETVGAEGSSLAEGSSYAKGSTEDNVSPETMDLFSTRKALSATPDDENVLVLTVIANEEAPIEGETLLEIARACDMRFGDMDIFHRFEEGSEQGALQFSMGNLVQPGSFDINTMIDEEFQGLTLFMSMSEPKDVLNAFECMLGTAELVAKYTGAEVADDCKTLLKKQNKQHYRDRIRNYLLQHPTRHMS